MLYLKKIWSEIYRVNLINQLFSNINPLNAELNPISHLPALLEAHNILHVIRIRVKGSSNKIWHPKVQHCYGYSYCSSDENRVVEPKK
jgi:hypothetical protein